MIATKNMDGYVCRHCSRRFVDCVCEEPVFHRPALDVPDKYKDDGRILPVWLETLMWTVSVLCFAGLVYLGIHGLSVVVFWILNPGMGGE